MQEDRKTFDFNYLSPSAQSQALELQEHMAVRFQSLDLLAQALLHRSAANTLAKQAGLEVSSNERLEFLGDTILQSVVTDYLFRQPEPFDEGVLSKVRASLVKESRLAQLARSINLGGAIILARSCDNAAMRDQNALLADSFEALLGAIYLDQGYLKAAEVTLRLYEQHIDMSGIFHQDHDFKTQLQELTQKLFKQRPLYELIEKSGPEHKLNFTVSACFADKTLGTGQGPTLKAASQAAAQQALQMLAQPHYKESLL